VSALGLVQGWLFIAILALQALTIHWLRDAVKSLTGRVKQLEDWVHPVSDEKVGNL
jgi:hypothetical protein